MTEARLVLLEEKVRNLEADDAALKAELSEIKSDVKQLLQLANMGKGAGWFIIKVGGALAGLIAFAWGVMVYFRPI